jgi:hypothetical protein
MTEVCTLPPPPTANRCCVPSINHSQPRYGTYWTSSNTSSHRCIVVLNVGRLIWCVLICHVSVPKSDHHSRSTRQSGRWCDFGGDTFPGTHPSNESQFFPRGVGGTTCVFRPNHHWVRIGVFVLLSSFFFFLHLINVNQCFRLPPLAVYFCE